MSTKTGIEWTDATWNPIRGCSRVSEGCRNCYAEKTAARFAGKGQPYEGLARIENVQREDGSTLTTRSHWTGEVRFVPEKLDEPLHWKHPKRVFVNSMSDLFHEKVQDEWIDRIFAVMALCPQHTFQILTKRPERMAKYLRETPYGEFGPEDRWIRTPEMLPIISEVDFTMPLPNVWLGVSVEDQKTADERIPLLLQTPAAVRWVSYEPALGPVDFSKYVGCNRCGEPLGRQHRPSCQRQGCVSVMSTTGAILNWIVAGGESGPGARPSYPDWFRSVRDQCQAAGVPFFFKQWGEYSQDAGLRVGKKVAGRLLDGREWSEYPQ